MKRKLIAVTVAAAVAVLAGAGTAETVKAYDPKEAVISTEGMGITYEAIDIDGVPGQEYIIVEKGTAVTEDSWADAQVPDGAQGNRVLFDGLNAATEYEIYTRVAATAKEKAGEPAHISAVTLLGSIGLDFDSDLVGATITVYPEPEDLEGYTYQWYQDAVTTDENGVEYHDPTEIEGETGQSYTFREEDAGKHIAVKIYRGGTEVGDAETTWPIAAYATVTFDGMGANTGETLQGVSYHEKLEEPETPVRAGYDFDGWYMFYDYSDKWDFDKDLVEWSEIVLYAKWIYRNDCAKDASCPIRDYNDMTVDAWYHDGVHYVLDNGIMVGVGGGKFAPDAVTNRAMMAQIMYNMEHEHYEDEGMSFGDVDRNAWYAKAVGWVSGGRKLMQGYKDGNFGPEDPLTREQMAVIFYNYAKDWHMEVHVPEAEVLDGYTDTSEISDWAREAMCWAVGNGLIKGKSTTTLNPRDYATRAEIATVILQYRMMEGEVKTK